MNVTYARAGESDRATPHLKIFEAEWENIYFEQIVLSFIVDLVFLTTIRIHKQIVNCNPNLSLSFWKFAILRFGHDVPFAILKYLSLSFLISS